MKMLVRLSAVALVVGMFWSSAGSLPVFAQPLQEGAWTAFIFTPGGEVAEATYEVKRDGSSTSAVMKWNSGEAPVMNLMLDGDRLTFSWEPSFFLQCRFDRQSTGQFKGACRDERENLGPAVLSPPGMPGTPKDIDFDKAFAIWNVPKEEYLKARYPQAAELAPPDVPEPKPLPSRTVEVAGRQVHLTELGSGDVTVVLEAGLGDDHKVWRGVQEGVADHARVVAYDRAGLGLSEPSSAPRTPAEMARELHDLLEAAGYGPPYVLVAHQSGAFTARAFGALYPGELQGLVLVDPSHEDEDAAFGQIDQQAWDEYVERRSAFFSAISPASADEFEGYLGVLADGNLPSADALSSRAAVVLSGVRPAEEPRWIGETEDGIAAKKALHLELAERLGGEHVVSIESTSYIHMEDPDLVIQAIEKVLAAIEG